MPNLYFLAVSPTTRYDFGRKRGGRVDPGAALLPPCTFESSKLETHLLWLFVVALAVVRIFP